MLRRVSFPFRLRSRVRAYSAEARPNSIPATTTNATSKQPSIAPAPYFQPPPKPLAATNGTTIGGSAYASASDQAQVVVPLDYQAFMGVTRMALAWTGSMCLLAFMSGTLGYSLWWHFQLDAALKAGRSFDEWFEDFDRNHDPVSQRLRNWGWSK